MDENFIIVKQLEFLLVDETNLYYQYIIRSLNVINYKYFELY